MTLVQSIRRSYQEFQQNWSRLADSAFGARDEMARGEFISAFITERGLSFPKDGNDGRPADRHI